MKLPANIKLLTRSLLRVSGVDSSQFLQGLITKNIKQGFISKTN